MVTYHNVIKDHDVDMVTYHDVTMIMMLIWSHTMMSQWIMKLIWSHTMMSQWIMMLPGASFIMYTSHKADIKSRVVWYKTTSVLVITSGDHCSLFCLLNYTRSSDLHKHN